MSEVICGKCGTTHTRKPNAKGTQCVECRRKYDRERYKVTPERNAFKAEYAKKRKAELYVIAIKHKMANPCPCGESRHQALQFDHRDQSTKVSEVSSMIREMRPKAEVIAEIAKCDVVCVNCHTMKTAEQGGWYEGVDITLPD